MSFERIVGNSFAIQRLRTALQTRRLAHAYLFAGPEGVGKCLTAVELARAELCRKGKGNACDACPDCEGVENRHHPNLSLIVRAAGDKNIRIETIREVQRALSLRSVDKRPRFVIIDDAHNLSEEAMNALLKTLEEPPLDTLIILVTPLPSALLPTLVSRCQILLFTILDEASLRRLLASERSLNDDDLDLVSLLSEGRAGEALRLARNIPSLRESIGSVQQALVNHNPGTIVDTLTRGRESEVARKEARQALNLLCLALREIFHARVLGLSLSSPKLATPEMVARYQSTDLDTFADVLNQLMETQHLINLNANVALTLMNGLLRV